MEFAIEAFHNEHLPLGGTTIDAVVTVSAGGEPVMAPSSPSRSSASPSTAYGTAVVIVIDTSGSMSMPRAKIRAARRAAAAAVAAMPQGAAFAVLAGSGQAVAVYPPVGLALVSPAAIAAAQAECFSLRASGGTAMSTWLRAARDLLVTFQGDVRQMILLTDGKNEGEAHHEFDAAVRSCVGVFRCDCRGVGTDWSVSELRTIATALSGSIDIVAEPDELAADFEAIVRRTAAVRSADVRLRISLSPGSSIEFVKQLAPSIDDLTGKVARVDDRSVDVPLGAWGAEEERDYHLRLAVAPRSPGDELLACRLAVTDGDSPAATALLRAQWTDDPAMSTAINARVAHATGQEELASAIVEGLSARSAGDDATATERLGRAVQLATESGHHDTLQLLRRVVEVEDPATGTVRLKRDVRAVDEMTLDTRASRTVSVRRVP